MPAPAQLSDFERAILGEIAWFVQLNPRDALRAGLRLAGRLSDEVAWKREQKRLRKGPAGPLTKKTKRERTRGYKAAESSLKGPDDLEVRPYWRLQAEGKRLLLDAPVNGRGIKDEDAWDTILMLLVLMDPNLNAARLGLAEIADWERPDGWGRSRINDAEGLSKPVRRREAFDRGKAALASLCTVPPPTRGYGARVTLVMRYQDGPPVHVPAPVSLLHADERELVVEVLAEHFEKVEPGAYRFELAWPDEATLASKSVRKGPDLERLRLAASTLADPIGVLTDDQRRMIRVRDAFHTLHTAVKELRPKPEKLEGPIQWLARDPMPIGGYSALKRLSREQLAGQLRGLDCDQHIPVDETALKTLADFKLQEEARQGKLAELRTIAAGPPHPPHADESGASTSSRDELRPSVEPGAFLSETALASTFKVNQNSLRTRLRKWRPEHMNNDWHRPPNRRRGDPEYIYRVESVMPVIEILRANSRKPATKPDKNI